MLQSVYIYYICLSSFLNTFSIFHTIWMTVSRPKVIQLFILEEKRILL